MGQFEALWAQWPNKEAPSATWLFPPYFISFHISHLKLKNRSYCSSPFQKDEEWKRKWKVVLTFWPFLKIIWRLETRDWIERLLTSRSSAPVVFFHCSFFITGTNHCQDFKYFSHGFLLLQLYRVVACISKSPRHHGLKKPETLFPHCWMWEAGWSVTKIVYTSTYVLSDQGLTGVPSI